MIYLKFINLLLFYNIIYNSNDVSRENKTNHTNIHNTFYNLHNTNSFLEIDNEEFFKEMRSLFKNYNLKNTDYIFLYNIFSRIWTGPKHHESSQIIKSIFVSLKKPSFCDFVIGSKALCSNIYHFLVKELLPLYNFEMLTNLNINNFFHESTIFTYWKNSNIRADLLEYRNLYFSIYLNSITNLIVAAHKYHKFVIINYKKVGENLKYKMMVTDLYMHVIVAHIIQGFTLTDEFKELLETSLDNVKIIFSIDFSFYNKMIGFKKYFNRLKNLSILKKTSFCQNNVTLNELESIYKDWDEINKYKKKCTFRIRRDHFYGKHKLKHIECTKQDIKSFMLDVNVKYINNLKPFKDFNKIYDKKEQNTILLKEELYC
ncbi:hypothetical protein EHP00_1659 [Ecytonucleospora hepatopenaei]|uniref:Uncharacterized protein n=1 Tax=Ecytonucleospora hepatopenaei TaxID=646526 RepID=A0A1W0E817_9MICR|nr:hypothetical protein EHP00_1659 [Ecytonucleospora hepatopenaei]